MKKLSLLTLMLLFPCHVAQSKLPAGESLMTLRIEGEIEVDKAGRVSTHRLDTKLTDDVRDLVSSAVAQWTFEPPAVAGAPATARAPMRITLAARRTGKDYSVSVDNVVFLPREPELSKLTLVKTTPRPKPPAFMAVAVVTLSIGVDRSGRILDVAPTQCSIHAIERHVMPADACRDLEKRSVAAGRKFKLKYEPNGDAAPEAEPIYGVVAFHFRGRGIEIDDAAGRWRAEWRTPYRPAPGSNRKTYVSALRMHSRKRSCA